MNTKRSTRPRKSGSPRDFRLAANVMEEEAWDDAGPNMKLSKAFVVVLILHIVAVAGLAAFSFFEKKGTTKQADSASLPQHTATLTPGATKKPVPTVKAEPVTVLTEPVKTPELTTVVMDRQKHTAVIATEYGITEEELFRYNPDQLAGLVLSGTALKLPVAAVQAAEKAAAERPPVAPEVSPAELARIPETVEIVEVSPVVQPEPIRERPEPVREPERVAATKKSPSTSSKKTTTKPASSGGTHRVVKGENLYRIAKKHKVSLEALQKANGITDPSKIRENQVLVIPK